jgi:uncharacterized protein with GYD domain
MPLYMYQAGYTPESVASLIEDPQDRVKAVTKAFEAMGAEIIVGGYPFGEYDVLVIYDAPDDATAAALALAIAAGGATRSAKTTRLLTGEEWIKSLQKAQRSRYEPIRHRVLNGRKRWPLRGRER